MGVKKSPSICEKGPKVAASRVLSKGRCANLCNRVHKRAGTPVAIAGGQCPSLRHGGGTEASPERGSPPHALIALSRQMSGAKRSGCPTLVRNHEPEHQSTERFRDEAELRTPHQSR